MLSKNDLASLEIIEAMDINEFTLLEDLAYWFNAFKDENEFNEMLLNLVNKKLNTISNNIFNKTLP